MDSEKLNDLSELERSLAALRPAADGLAADAMLFAAGRASARTSKSCYLWPVATGCVALLAVALAGWVASERSERLALAQLLRNLRSAPTPPPAAVVQETRKTSPDSLLAAHLSLQRDFDAWLASIGPVLELPDASVRPGQPVLRAWQPNSLLDP
jgi:hypothetical protein